MGFSPIDNVFEKPLQQADSCTKYGCYTHAMSRLAWINLFALSLIWGAAFTFSGSAVREVGFASVVFLRVSLALIVLAGVLFIQKKLPRIGWRLLGIFLIMGLLNNLIPFGLLFWAQSPPDGGSVAKVSSGLASIFNALTPFFAMLVAQFVFFEEHLSARRLIGVGFGLGGVILLFTGVGDQATPGAPLTLQILAMSACTLAALSYGFGVVFGRRFARSGLNPTQSAFGQLLGSSLLALPFALFLDQPWAQPLPSLGFWGAIAGLAVLSTALAYMIYFWLIEHEGAVNAALVTLLIPASAMILGVLFLDERFKLFDFMGLALILLGLLVIDGRILNWRKGR